MTRKEVTKDRGYIKFGTRAMDVVITVEKTDNTAPKVTFTPLYGDVDPWVFWGDTNQTVDDMWKELRNGLIVEPCIGDDFI